MRRIAFHLLLLPVFGLLLVGTRALAPFDSRVYDQLMQLHQSPPPPEVLLVSIDGDSERRYPDFIDRRPLAMARLVDRLNQAKPRVIGAYVVYDPSDPRDRQGLDVLHQALARNGNAVGKVFAGNGRRRSAAQAWDDAYEAGFQAVGVQLVGVGEDSVVRGVFSAVPVGGTLRPSFALAVLDRAGTLVPADRRDELAALSNAADAATTFSAIAFYGGSGSVRTLRAADVLDGAVHPEVWRDRIVLVGQARQDSQMNMTTAVSAWADSGLTVDEFEAQAIAALLHGRVFLVLPPWTEAAVVAVLLLGFATLLRLLPQHRVMPGAVTAFAVLLAVLVAAYLHFLWLAPVALLLLMPVQLGLELARRFSRAAAQLAAELAVLRHEAEPGDAQPARLDFEQAVHAARAAIARIRQQREYVHRLVDVQPAAIVVLDHQQRVRLCNAQALAWRVDLASPVATLREWLAAVDLRLPSDAAHYVGTGSARLLGRCGDRDVIVAVEPLPAGRADGETDTLICVTEVSTLVADQRERQAAIDFLSHDLRAPAYALIELCEGAQQDPGLAPKTQQILHTAERLSRRLVQMATTYLDFVRSASPEAFTRTDPVLLADVVAEAAETSAPEAAGKGVRLHLALEHAESAWVTGDAALLRRAVENLLSNALKVTPAGGTVEVRLQRIGGALSIAVCDEGPGIAPARRSQLFQRFGSLPRSAANEARSMGLGLAMVMSVVARHRGSLFVDDRPAGGAEFRIELPAEAQPGG